MSSPMRTLRKTMQAINTIKAALADGRACSVEFGRPSHLIPLRNTLEMEGIDITIDGALMTIGARN